MKTTRRFQSTECFIQKMRENKVTKSKQQELQKIRNIFRSEFCSENERERFRGKNANGIYMTENEKGCYDAKKQR